VKTRVLASLKSSLIHSTVVHKIKSDLLIAESTPCSSSLVAAAGSMHSFKGVCMSCTIAISCHNQLPPFARELRRKRCSGGGGGGGSASDCCGSGRVHATVAQHRAPCLQLFADD
jgi:hypothetical protein